MGSEKPPKFEKALENLDDIVELMEIGELPLDKALELFEKGIALTRQCQTALDQAEQKVETLMSAREKDDAPDE